MNQLLSILRWGGTRLAPPALFAIFVVAVWELVVRWKELPEFLLPAPSQIVAECFSNPTEIISAAAVTAVAAISGLLASLLIGVGLACLFSQSPWIRRSLNPYAICLQTTPIISIAPLIIIWLGEGLPSVIAIAFIISFFPILTNTTTGLLNVPAGLQELFRLYDANRWQRLLKLQFPNSLPYLATGLKTSGGLAVLGAIVGDFFAGYSQTQKGLGYLIYQYRDHNVPLMFGAIFAATLLGLIFFATISTLTDRFLLFWCDKRLHS